MLFKSKDGELRIYDYQGSGASGYYTTILFTDANLSFPLGRPGPEEVLNMDRGKANATMSYSLGTDDPVFAPLDLSVSCKMSDQSSTTWTSQWLSGVTIVHGKTLVSWKGKTSIDVRGSAVSTMTFSDLSKTAYNVEVLWDGPSVDVGYQIREVYFPPNRQTIAEGADAVTMNLSGLIYGDVSRISSFTSGCTLERLTP